MPEHQHRGNLEPEIVSHLAESMDEVPPPETHRPEIPAAGAGQQWPDGSGKHRHPKERATDHGRVGHEAAPVAVHRTGRPDMPHSS
ncbi:hypothetical protein [Arthrobacter sp. 92]|jgi:hypothetical protein|uniref:hypothetical protein n=1 Tax=Arthrobacter sp. 92 TaxID=3418175 RepID=UPI003D051CCB